MRRFIVGLLAVALLAVLIPGVAFAKPHVLVFADGADLTSLNPLEPQAAPNNELNFLTMAYLTRYTTGGLQAELATEVPTERNGGISSDGRSITYRLRPGLKWSDGDPLTSADVAFSVALIKNPATNSLYRDNYKKIVSVDTPNSATVVFHLTNADGNALDLLFGTRSAPILPKHLLDGVDANTAGLWGKPVGGGPFRFVSWSRGDDVVLEANPYYALGRPKLTRIVYKMIPTESTAIDALRTGEISYLLAQAYSEYAPIKDLPEIHAAISSGVRPSFLAFNAQNVIVRDPAVRRALRLATDRAGLLQRSFLGGGVLSETVLSPGDPARATIPLVPFDSALAGKLLDEDGWKLGSDGVRSKAGRRLTLELVGATGSTFVAQILELVRLQWARAGVEIQTKRYPISLMFAEDGILYGGKFTVALFSLGQIRVSDLEDAFSCATISPNGGNMFRLCDKTLDTMLAKAKQTYDPKDSIPLYVGIQRKLFDDAPAIPIALRNEYNLYRDGVVAPEIPPFALFADPMKIDVTK